MYLFCYEEWLFAGSAETLPALLFSSFSLLGCFGHIKGGNGIKKVFSG